MKDIFQFKLDQDIDNEDFIFTASKKLGSKVYFVTWNDKGKKCHELYHEIDVRVYIETGNWIIQHY